MDLKSFANKRVAAKEPAPEKPAKPPSETMPRLVARVSPKSERIVRQMALDLDVTVTTLIVRAISHYRIARGLEPLEEAVECP